VVRPTDLTDVLDPSEPGRWLAAGVLRAHPLPAAHAHAPATAAAHAGAAAPAPAPLAPPGCGTAGAEGQAQREPQRGQDGEATGGHPARLCFTFPGRPGLVLLPGAVPPEQQLRLVRWDGVENGGWELRLVRWDGVENGGWDGVGGVENTVFCLGGTIPHLGWR
jgi:hypothetical protein